MSYKPISAGRGQLAAGYLIVELPAEVDLLNAPDVSDMLLSALNRGAAGVIADMSRTRFCDAAGCRAVARVSRRARLLGTWARAVIPSPAVRKVFRLTGADQLIPVCTTLDDALALLMPADGPGQSFETPGCAEHAGQRAD
jgi:anti-sigma B factor antagonist